jgi:hypothetical protein
MQYQATATATGVKIYIDPRPGSTATSANVGVYNNSTSAISSGVPTTPVTNSTCSLTSFTIGWKSCAVASPSITAGNIYWLAILPTGGSLNLVGATSGGYSRISAANSGNALSDSNPSLDAAVGANNAHVVLTAVETPNICISNCSQGGGGTNTGGSLSGTLLVGQDDPLPGNFAISDGQTVYVKYQAVLTGSGQRNYLDITGGTAGSVTVGLFSDNAGVPGGAVAGGSCSLSTTVGWSSCAVSAHVTAGTSYWLSVTPTGGNVSVKGSPSDFHVNFRGTEDVGGSGGSSGGGGFGDSP